MKYIKYITILLLPLFIACNQEDYLIDGGRADQYAHANETTLEFLKSHPMLDTLALAIERAGLEDIVNGEITLFAPTDFSFNAYIAKEYALGVLANPNNPDYQYTFDSIPVEILKDSLLMYMFSGKIYRTSLSEKGIIFSSLSGQGRKLSKEPVKVYESYLDNNPEYLFYTKEIVGKEFKERIQTSGIITKNGIVHVINNSHKLFFYE